MTDIEDRLRATLREVADRIPDDEPELDLPASTPRHRGRWLVAAAAAVVVAGATALLIGSQHDRLDETPVRTDEPRRTLLTVTIDGFDVELRADGDCVVPVAPTYSFDLDLTPACVGDAALPLQATVAGGRTLVWGLHPTARRFTGTVEEVSIGDVHEAALADGLAFLLVIDAMNASGTVEARDANGAVLATGAFDHGGPAREPKGVLGDEALDYAFARDGAIWARGVDGTVVRLTDGTPRSGNGWPSTSPDGKQVLYAEDHFDSIFWQPMAISVGDGATRERPSFATRWSPSGALVAGLPPKDDEVPEEVVVTTAQADGEVARISLGESTRSYQQWSLAWYGEDELLAVTAGRAMRVDLTTLTATELVLSYEAGGVGDELIIAEQSTGSGGVLAIRLTDTGPQLGQLVLDGDTLTYVDVVDLPTSTDEAELDVGDSLYIDVRHGDLPPLIGDGKHLFELRGEDGLVFLAADVEHASAP